MRREGLLTSYRQHPGRGGCGVGALVDLKGKPSHELVEWALQGLSCLEHRGGAIDATGDGAGILLATDPEFFAPFIAPGRHLPEGQHLAVGVLFLPMGEANNLPHWQHEIDSRLRSHGLLPLGWRHVPTHGEVLGAKAAMSRRDVWQVLVGEGMVPLEDLPRVMWRVKALLEQKVRDLYVASFAPRTLVYKALVTGSQLADFYPDLKDPRLRTEAVVFHRRFSTNTFSNWYLAQTFRTLGHNGEINTIKACRNAVQNLEAELRMFSLLMPQGSDSADMDRVVELFVSHGVSLPETLSRLMPMAWRDLPRLPAEEARYYRGVQRALGPLGAWEGPAAVVAQDGEYVVGALDRMGLRPLRWMRTHSGRFLLASELGAVQVPFEDVAETGQLDPGEALAVHLPSRQVLVPEALRQRVVAKTPINFAELSEHRLLVLERNLAAELPPRGSDAAYNLFGWTHARLRSAEHVSREGHEPVTSMGFDRPLPVLSPLRPPITKYFQQIVAVVTNPALDPIREAGAFDLTVHLGSAPRVHENEPVYDPLPQYRVESPVLTGAQLQTIVEAGGSERPVAVTLDCTYDDPNGTSVQGAKALSRRIAEVVRQAEALVKRGEATILVLSDRAALGTERLPLPMVLVASALHNALTSEGRRRHASIVIDSGEIQEGHDAAVLVANGADALHPYLYLGLGSGQSTLANLVQGMDQTLLRIMSKMGICSIDGYRGSRLFEAVGLAPALVDHYLPGITSRLGGLELEDLYDDARVRRRQGGRTLREPEAQVYRKEVWQQLQAVAKGDAADAWSKFNALITETPPVYLRDLLRLAPARSARPLEQVATEEEIIASTFRGAAMSHGALHRVAHRAIAAAFNTFGAMSNCGEGGEDSRREPGGAWEPDRSRIRQVASGRFGVDARYLVHADELSIKIGQGAKPGEGGMLPAAKVTAEVAAIRRTQQGVTLISPPPHHDIYSIEDLAQLIYNLRQVNPRAAISVKVPAVTDLGTIVVGIAKAGADVVEISGFEGGTGAASSSSIEHAGLPLERGLSEAHQALAINGIRDRIRLRADGGLKTGFDVAVALALGADEVSLGTALMIAEQCIFCHGCAAGTCPAGITTQSELVARRLMVEKKGRAKDDRLEEADERYQDARAAVSRYLKALAGDLRERLAALGLSRPTELTGRVELLERRDAQEIDERVRARAEKLDLAELLTQVEGTSGKRLKLDPVSELNARICEDSTRGGKLGPYPLRNTDRAVGATLAGVRARGGAHPECEIRLVGYAGQALAFACVDGLTIDLEGLANDGVAEAMSGGVVSVRAPFGKAGLSLVGNAAAYGATGGKLFVAGHAGQRLGVRNSGATIVVEGAGKYAFEYMTGGVGVVLGSIAPVLGSGLTGGVVYLLAQDQLASLLHQGVSMSQLSGSDAQLLKALLEEHLARTGSSRAESLLSPFEPARFVKVVPKVA